MYRSKWLIYLVVCWLLLQAHWSIQAADWPAFRGPDNNGTTIESGFPIEWSPTKNILWRVPLPGPGNSSPIVVGERIFVTCANSDGSERTLYCFGQNDGQELWKQTVTYEAKEATHKTNPFCPTTPVSDGILVYVWHGSAGMYAYSMVGSPLWSRDLGTFHHIWGLGASPILVGDLVVQICGPGERTFVAALDRNTGQVVWQTPIEKGGSDSAKGRYVGTWSTPLKTKAGHGEQLICCFHSRVVGLDPKDGHERWTMGGLSSDRADLAYAMPMLSGNRAVIMGGYGGPEFGFQMNDQGLVSESDQLWQNEKSEKNGYHPQRIGSGIAVDGHLFMANSDDAGSIECLEVATGTRTWVERRTTDGPHWGSMVLADGRLYIPGQKGITRVVKVNPAKYELIAENDLGEHCNATPAFSNGQIFIRTFDALYAIGNR